MNKDNAGQFLLLVQALHEGKTIQVYDIIHGWTDIKEIKFDSSPESYRIKPEPKLRPWKPEEVPVGALFRSEYWGKGSAALILGVSADKEQINYISVDGVTRAGLNSLLEYCEYSTDNGKTWKPCGVEE